MRTFEIYVTDDRYSVPTLLLATVNEEARAREIAERLLDESVHHLGVEVCEGGRLLFSLETRGDEDPSRHGEAERTPEPPPVQDGVPA